MSQGDLTYFAYASKVCRTQNWLDGSPHWVDVTGAITGTIRDFLPDPFDEENEAWVMASTGLWHTTDLASTPPTWTLILSRATIVAWNAGWDDTNNSPSGPWCVRRSRSDADYVGILFEVALTAISPQDKRCTIYAHSHDHGVTWPTWTSLGNTTFISTGVCNVSDYTIDRVWAKYLQTDGTSHNSRKSSDHGHSFGAGHVMFKGMGTIELPFDGTAPTDEYIYEAGRITDAFTAPGMDRSVDFGANWTAQLATHSAVDYGGGRPHGTIHTFGALDIVMIGTDGPHISSAEADHHFFSSSDGGDNWTHVSDMPILDSGEYFSLTRFSANHDYIYCLLVGNDTTPDDIVFSDDGGVTWMSKLGDFATEIDADPQFMGATPEAAMHGFHMLTPLEIPIINDAYVHAVEMGYTGIERGIPMPGDRSAWNDLDYPEVHAKDLFDGIPTHHLPPVGDDGDVLTVVAGVWEPAADGGPTPDYGPPVIARYGTNAAQSIPNTTETRIDFEDQLYDPDALVTTGSAWVFTAPNDGYYLLDASILFASAAT